MCEQVNVTDDMINAVMIEAFHGYEWWKQAGKESAERRADQLLQNGLPVAVVAEILCTMRAVGAEEFGGS